MDLNLQYFQRLQITTTWHVKKKLELNFANLNIATSYLFLLLLSLLKLGLWLKFEMLVLLLLSLLFLWLLLLLSLLEEKIEVELQLISEILIWLLSLEAWLLLRLSLVFYCYYFYYYYPRLFYEVPYDLQSKLYIFLSSANCFLSILPSERVFHLSVAPFGLLNLLYILGNVVIFTHFEFPTEALFWDYLKPFIRIFYQQNF